MVEFSLPNGGPGPDPYTPGDADADTLVVLFLRDHYCTKCRDQVQRVADRYEEFREHDAEVAAVLPEPKARAAEWADRYDLGFPVLADPEADVADEFDQPVRFGVLGELSDFAGRMPQAVVLDPGTGGVLWRHQGSMPADRPDEDDLLAQV